MVFYIQGSTFNILDSFFSLKMNFALYRKKSADEFKLIIQDI